MCITEDEVLQGLKAEKKEKIDNEKAKRMKKKKAKAIRKEMTKRKRDAEKKRRRVRKTSENVKLSGKWKSRKGMALKVRS